MSVAHPQVTIITPTYNRPHFLPSIHRYVLNQTFTDWEWRILDDSDEPCLFMQQLNDPRIHYQHATSHPRQSNGLKRNQLNAAARGSVIVQFDDDDYYAPHYIQTALTELDARQADIIGLIGWYVYDYRHRFFGYWDFDHRQTLHYVLSSTQSIHTHDCTTPNWDDVFYKMVCGYGFSHVYRRCVWEAYPFQDMTWNEDGTFVNEARNQFKVAGYHDHSGLAVHFMHHGNNSRCFPQFQIPAFLLKQCFPDPDLRIEL